MEHLSCFNEPLFRHQRERVFCVPSAHMRCVPGLTQFEEENDYFPIAKDYQVFWKKISFSSFSSDIREVSVPLRLGTLKSMLGYFLFSLGEWYSSIGAIGGSQ
ncbi:hypothetical protein Ahy_A01g002109 isoform C [Arachis hypogaea]|uniref:Uncharacterized protein n=1 Tax=Arachis hypogaea TaxID=3818 RepID=A0A445EQK3_ARAHY|nr:hypothetical protein Ahy_A01g002109 isoform C [Arachis hypogaea]